MATFWHLAVAATSCPSGTVPWPNEPCEPIKEATAKAHTFLRENIFPFDVPMVDNYFGDGIVGPTVALALEARTKFGWAASVPRDIFNGAVLPYANVDEARTNWRQFLWDVLASAPWLAELPSDASLETVALRLNAEVWKQLGELTNKSCITFHSEQTPLIYDTMSTILFGFASCTGISITFVDALRTLGVPARLVGTPAWHGKPADGNHNWVEVWTGEGEGDGAGGWHFIEGSPAGAGESLTNPCDKWFCNPAHMQWADGKGTEVFAALYQAQPARAPSWYPMSWDTSNHGVAGENRTAYYVSACMQC